MQQSLLPLLLLAIIALCSANELPFLTQLELDKVFDDQDNDNNDKLENIKEIMFKQQLNKPLKSKIYETEENEINLDNLNEYNNDYLTYRKQNERNPQRSPKDFSKKNAESDASKKIKLIEDSLKNYEEIVTVSPLLILKIRLSYLTNNIENMKPKLYHYSMPVPINFMTNTKDELNKIPQDDINSFLDYQQQDDEGFETDSKSTKNKKVVKKRIFSLWSRLQGLQRGHELHHRRHLHAFYGLPDDGGGGRDSTLTAETRATFLRPPGSPLRWG